ncbi:hypothetical protein ACFVH9_20400 [Streptomyces hirsutus]|uniref:hypothetical protein n=1 Tax=Streptomyces hirsutus TaxID=35620 RepID=UPI00363C25F4
MHAPDAAGTPLNWDLYRAAVVDIRFGDRAVRVEPRPRGTAEGFFPVPAAGSSATVHVITAWNPRGRTASDDANVTYATDPVCGARWHVWDRTSPLRRLARPHVDGTG